MKLSDAKQIPEERDADQRERMLRGELYFSADAGLVEERHRARRLCRAYNATTEEQGEERLRLLKELLGGTGKTLTIEPEFICDYGTYMTVGRIFMPTSAWWCWIPARCVSGTTACSGRG